MYFVPFFWAFSLYSGGTQPPYSGLTFLLQERPSLTPSSPSVRSEHYLTSFTCLMIRTYKLLLVVTEPINPSAAPPPAAARLQSVCKWPSPRQFLQSANEWSETRSCHPSPCSWAVESGGEQRGVAVSRVSVVCLPATRDTHGITGHRL